jgi:hypothetical protein
MKRALCSVLSIAIALQSSIALAGADDDAKAKALFDEARELAKANKWAEACEKLAASKKLSSRMLTTYRLADCHERIGKTASAHAGFIEAADLAKSAGDSTKQQDALDRAKKVEGKLAKITVSLADDDASIKIDDNAIANALIKEKIPVDPGEHTLTATAPGKKARNVTFTVPPGPSVTNVDVPALDPEPKKTDKPVVDRRRRAPPPIDDTKPPEAKSGSGMKTIGFIALGVGAVGLGVGTALGLSAKSLDGDAEKLCTARGCTAEGKALNDDARSRGNLATVVFTAGALIAVTGVVLVIAAPSSSSSESKTTAHVSPWAGPNGGGLSLWGSF